MTRNELIEQMMSTFPPDVKRFIQESITKLQVGMTLEATGVMPRNAYFIDVCQHTDLMRWCASLAIAQCIQEMKPSIDQQEYIQMIEKTALYMGLLHMIALKELGVPDQEIGEPLEETEQEPHDLVM